MLKTGMSIKKKKKRLHFKDQK